MPAASTSTNKRGYLIPNGVRRENERKTGNVWSNSAAAGAGVDENAMKLYPSPPTAVRETLKEARPGDLMIFLALTQREEVFGLIYDIIGR